jgi:hypothetical protein
VVLVFGWVMPAVQVLYTGRDVVMPAVQVLYTGRDVVGPAYGGSLWFVCAGVERASREGSSYIYTLH